MPQSALLSANGLHSAGEVRSGMRIVVPVYNAHGDTHVAKVEEEAKPRRSAKVDDEDAKPRHAKKDDDEDAKPRHAKKDDDEDAKPRHVAKSDDDDDAKPRHKAKSDDDDDSDKPHHKSKAKDADDETAKSHKIHKVEADDNSASKIAKVEAPAERPAKAAKVVAETKPAKDPVKAVAPVQVAKADPPKVGRKPEVDKTPTADIPAATADAASTSEAGQLRWPARGRIISGFKQAGNDGINIALPEGTSVRAAEDGKVAYAGNALKGYGNLVLIRHTNGMVTAYANNGELDVKGGETVKRGQVIAKSGQTGDVSTPQLHFEVRKGQTPVDPTGYLAGL